MGKKRKTRKEKIILHLKRQLHQQAQIVSEPKKNKTSQEAIPVQVQTEPIQLQEEKKGDDTAFSGDLKLIRRDLLKTLILTFIIISFEIVLYLYLK